MIRTGSILEGWFGGWFIFVSIDKNDEPPSKECWLLSGELEGAFRCAGDPGPGKRSIVESDVLDLPVRYIVDCRTLAVLAIAFEVNDPFHCCRS